MKSGGLKLENRKSCNLSAQKTKRTFSKLYPASKIQEVESPVTELSYRKYNQWFHKHMALEDQDRIKIKSHIVQFPEKLLISILFPICDADPRKLVLTLKSVQEQLYHNWELILTLGKDCRDLTGLLDEYVRFDNRIRFNSAPSETSPFELVNQQIHDATGEFCIIIESGDRLAEDALYQVNYRLNLNPDLELIYSDEDMMSLDGIHSDPIFKPAWNKELLQVDNYLGKSVCFRRSHALQAGGFDPDLKEHQRWDLNLKLMEQTGLR